MPKLIFRAALIRYVDLRYDDKAKAKYVKINFTAAFSAPVREAMEWEDLPASYPSAKLDGELSAKHFILTPDDKELRMHELQMAASGINSFEVHRVKVGDDSTEVELRFQLTTSVPGAAAMLESYIEQFGKGTAALRVNYEQQSELDMEDDKQQTLATDEPDTGCIACNNGIPMAEGSVTVHDSGAVCTKPTAIKDIPLASAATMGGTHQRRKPREDKSTVN